MTDYPPAWLRTSRERLERLIPNAMVRNGILVVSLVIAWDGMRALSRRLDVLLAFPIPFTKIGTGLVVAATYAAISLSLGITRRRIVGYALLTILAAIGASAADAWWRAALAGRSGDSLRLVVGSAFIVAIVAFLLLSVVLELRRTARMYPNTERDTESASTGGRAS